MPYYVISYDLRNKSEQSYEKLYEAFAKEDCVKCQESTYLMYDSYTAEQVLAYFKGFIHSDDLLTVVEFSKMPSNHLGLKGTRDWIEKHWP